MNECAQARRAVLERLAFFFFFFFTLNLIIKIEKTLQGFEQSSQIKFPSFAIRRSSAFCLSEQRPTMNKTGMHGRTICEEKKKCSVIQLLPSPCAVLGYQPCQTGHEARTSFSPGLGLED